MQTKKNQINNLWSGSLNRIFSLIKHFQSINVTSLSNTVFTEHGKKRKQSDQLLYLFLGHRRRFYRFRFFLTFNADANDHIRC